MVAQSGNFSHEIRAYHVYSTLSSEDNIPKEKPQASKHVKGIQEYLDIIGVAGDQ